jgi:hypothetical protein
MSPAVRTYLTQNKGKFNDVAFFCTMSGSGDVGTFTHMSELVGKKPKVTLSFLTKEVMKDDISKSKKFCDLVSKLKK